MFRPPPGAAARTTSRPGAAALRHLVAAAVLVLLCSARPPAARARLGPEHASEIIKIEGRELPPDLPRTVSQLELLSDRGDGLRRIALQVDERTASGDLALPEGPERVSDTRPGTLDDNDLLVFAARDLGARSAVPDVVAIRIADPINGASGWLPGDCPGVGYTLTHWRGIGRGTYRSSTVVRAFPTYDRFAIQQCLYTLDHPLVVTINPPQ